MPTQWRTIAPIVGRTATQCLERYQKLLDDAEQRENAELGLTGVGAEAGPSADDIRKLRPGETDPDPETKPARPDPVDMDEDEKEMLSEARARLANTQGKKAKRKARERQLEEARRLATLQKRRELKAAGIISMHGRHRGKGMDYNADIPFEKPAAIGFYDTTEEKYKVDNGPVGQSLRQLEGPKRKNNEEDEERRKRQKKFDDKGKDKAAPNFTPEKDAQIQRLKEAQQIGSRSKLNLPMPQVGDRELEEIVKIGQAGENARLLVDDGGNESGRGLLGEYTNALATAQNTRTPRAAPQEDSVMLEARNLRNMTVQQTPLLGDENTPLHQLPNRGTGFEGATPRNNFAATPNPLATPYRKDDPSLAATPRSEVGVGATPLRTPLRDSLSINVGDATPYEMTPRDEKARVMQARQRLKSGFMNLPAPKNDFELVDPEDVIVQDEERVARSEDAAERDARNASRVAEEERLRLFRRSSAIKRGLPRPVDLDVSQLLSELSVTVEDAKLDLDRQVTVEMLKLLEHDAIVHPVAGGSRPGGGHSGLPTIDDADLREARSAVHTELATAIGLPGASEEAVERLISSSVDVSAFDSAWTPLYSSLAFDPSTKAYVSRESLSDDAYLAGLVEQIEGNRSTLTRDAEKTQKAENKLGKTLGGYNARSKALDKRLAGLYATLDEARVTYQSFQTLADLEESAVPRRMGALREEVEKLQRTERQGQAQFQELTVEKDEVLARIQLLEEELMMQQAEAINEAALAE